MTDPLVVDDVLIDRYAAGECSPDEVERVGAWIGSDPLRQARVARAKALWESARSPSGHWDVDQAWKRARATIDAGGEPRRPADAAAVGQGLVRSTPEPAVPRPGRAQLLSHPDRTARFAAAACVAIGIGLVAWWAMSVGQPMAAAETIATGPRQRVTVELRDGSRVVLAPESRLVEPAGFGVSAREVELQGAAYFEVVHDASRPFVVVTHDLRIRDLGTRFAVDAYAARSTVSGARAAPTTTRVAVTAGSIEMEAVGSRTKSASGAGRADGVASQVATVVRAGHVGRIDQHGRITVSQPVDIQQYVSWTTNDLAFDDVALGEVIPRLERWYGAQIVIGDPGLACRHITATFHDESLDQVLDELSLALHAHRERSAGGAITLTSITLTSADTRPQRTGSSAQMSDTAAECAGYSQTAH